MFVDHETDIPAIDIELDKEIQVVSMSLFSEDA